MMGDNTSLSATTALTISMAEEATTLVQRSLEGKLPTLILADTVHFWMGKVTLVILSSLGIVTNLVTMAVWSAKSAFSPTIFLFKLLALLDTMFLASVIIYTFIFPSSAQITPGFVTTVFHVGNFVQLLSVHVTLLIAIIRWIAVKYVLRVRSLLTSTRIYLPCVFFFVYCGILEGAQVLSDQEYLPGDNVVYVTKRVVGLALPLLLLLGFSLSLMRTAMKPVSELREFEMQERSRQKRECKDQSETPTTESVWLSQSADITTTIVSLNGNVRETAIDDEKEEADKNDCEAPGMCFQDQEENDSHDYPRDEEQQQQQQQQQHQHHHHHQQQQQRDNGRQQKQHQQKEKQQKQNNNIHLHHHHPHHHHHRPSSSSNPRRPSTLKAVIAVCLSSFLAYPVGNSLQMVALYSPRMDLMDQIVVVNVALICQVINSGINVVIYWFFLSNFRTMAVTLWNRVCACVRCATVNPPRRHSSSRFYV